MECRKPVYEDEVNGISLMIEIDEEGELHINVDDGNVCFGVDFSIDELEKVLNDMKNVKMISKLR